MGLEGRLAHYQILGKLGAGGMGEVYRAEDTRLGRQVALKVLPSDVAAEADRVARFRREAQLLAALQHPRIAAIHGVEEIERQRVLVLELVEGEDLSERLRRGALDVEQALEVGRQLAEALEADHE
jgi:serine/threonine protein kinase